MCTKGISKWRLSPLGPQVTFYAEGESGEPVSQAQGILTAGESDPSQWQVEGSALMDGFMGMDAELIIKPRDTVMLLRAMK